MKDVRAWVPFSTRERNEKRRKERRRKVKRLAEKEAEACLMR